MFIACPACETHYKLDDLALGPKGRKVRCASCGHVWRATLPQEEPDELPPETVDRFTTTEPMRDEDMSLSFTADAPFTQNYDPSFDVPHEEQVFERPPIPEGIVGAAHHDEPAVHSDVPEYMPLGMSPNMLGLCVFLLPFLVTVGLLLAFKSQLLRTLPALSPVYAAMGSDVTPPGDGLRLSTLVAERKIERDKKTLSMSAQLANISPVALPYPALRATAFGPYGTVIETWNLPAPEGRMLASGEEAPIRAEFKDIPDAAAKLELRVTQK